VTENTPEPYQEWLKLIQDSLDEQVDETSYHKTKVLRVVNLIKTDGLTPEDRAQMKDEYSQEEAVKIAVKKDLTKFKNLSGLF
jgi:hypothetical protein